MPESTKAVSVSPAESEPSLVLAASIKTVAQAMDEHGTSAWVATVGVALIAFALGTQEGSWSHIGSDEFLAVLATGLVFVLTGVTYRFYVRIRADAALRGVATRSLGEAETAKRTAVELITKMADDAPR
jgi:hypothetical protein